MVATCLVLLLLPLVARAGLLGYGKGAGSCAAFPFRSYHVQWTHGCPAFAPCCSEFGYCRPLVCIFTLHNRAGTQAWACLASPAKHHSLLTYISLICLG